MTGPKLAAWKNGSERQNSSPNRSRQPFPLHPGYGGWPMGDRWGNPMKEGWCRDTYVIVFDDAESEKMTKAYGIDGFVAGYRVAAILGWDDFILVNEQGGQFRVPTVPLDARYMKRFEESWDTENLIPDERLTGKIKWYIKPIVLGGDPDLGRNVTWVDIKTHQKLVRWWNHKYRELSEKK